MNRVIKRSIERQASRIATRKKCNIVLIIGGSKIEAIKYHGRAANTLTYVLDNPDELQKWLEVCRDLGITTVNVGRGHTSTTLAETVNGYFSEVISRVAQMNATSGCGASPLLGYLAAIARVTMSDFKLLLAQLYGAIFAKTGGVVEEVRLRLLISDAGGCGAGVFRPAALAFLSILRRLGVPVQVDIEVVGAGVYSDIFPRTRLTAAAVIPFLLAFILDRSDPRDRRVVKSVTFCELPPGLTPERRSACLLNEEVALCCGDFKVKFDLLRPNNSTTSLYGNVALRETDYFYALDPANDIAGRIASTYLSEIDELRSSIAPDSTAINEIEYVDKATTRHAKTIDQISSSLMTFSPESIIGAVKAREFNYDYDLFVSVTRGERFDCAKLRHEFSSLPRDLSDCFEKCALVDTFLERLNIEREAFEASSIDIGNDSQALEGQLGSLIKKLISKRSWWDFLVTFGASSDESLLSAFKSAALSLRAKSNDLANNEAALKKILVSIETLHREREALEGRIRAVTEMLQSFLPRGSEKESPSLVTVSPIDAHFPGLVEAASRSREIQLSRLQLCAGTVTIEGLARITNAVAPRADAIADAIVNGEPEIIGPPHGAVECQDHPTQMYVLPPVEKPLAELLIKVFEDRYDITNVAFYETLVGGANVLRFRFRFPRDAREIMTGSLLEELQAAIESPNPELFFPGEADYAKIGGIRIEKDSFAFVEPECSAVHPVVSVK